MNSTTGYKLKFDQGTIIVHLSFENGHLHRYTWRSSRHCNAEYEIHTVLKGSCILEVEDTHHNLCGGQAVLIAPGKYHKPYVQSGDFMRLSLSFSVPDSSLSSALQNTVPQSKSFSLTEDALYYCNKLITECNCKRPLQESAQHALLTLLVISLLRNLSLVKYILPAKQKQDDQERIALIDNFFERSFTGKGGSGVLANQLHLSTRQLGRILKEYYGMGFHEKLTHARMDHAALLLRTTEKHVQEIIETVGYSSATSFYKAFSKHFHTTPQQYRFTHRKHE